jgi:hypothetical protein
MYPHVTQFETRDRLLREELQLLRERRSRSPQRRLPRSQLRPFSLAFPFRGQAGSSQ